MFKYCGKPVQYFVLTLWTCL